MTASLPLNPECLSELPQSWQMAEVPQGASCATIEALAPEAWLASQVPGSSYGTLLAAGRIPDPFFGMNEREVRWVSERSWAWRTQFDVSELAAHEELVFEGLDTYCTVWLNGTLLLTSNNMFLPQRVDARALLRVGRNDLVLRFDPPLARAREQEAALGRRSLWNGDTSRLYARKAQYHFGWDWGPELLCAGPWRPVRRHRWSARVEDLHCRTHVDLDSRSAWLEVHSRIDGPAGLQVQVVLLGPQGHEVARAEHTAAAGSANLAVPDAQLWWPRGLGEQPLYRLQVRVLDGGTLVAQEQRRIGLRTLRLVQEPVSGEPGSSFYFEVNGQAFFAGGANWIPDDNLLERVTPQRYRERVLQAAEAHMNMLRVWGGGIYEHEAFYEACDELGLLVWQDFMFACGIYPAHPGFRESVRQEARSAVRRLRHHACLALWCGNNEDYALAESLGIYGPGVAGPRFDARDIYEQLLPEVCAELDPDRPYWPGSPYSPTTAGVKLSSDPTVGDRHSWEVWNQQMLPYQRYGEVQARFVSEFGMQSHPSLALLESVVPPEQRFPESRTVQWHNRAGAGTPDGHRRLAVYMSDNLRVGPSLADQVYATQFVQAEAMRVAYQDFRRRWQRPGARAVGGALVWQLNDCWPATSWALIDSAGVKKPAWHAVRRALAPLAVALRREGSLLRASVMNGGVETCALRLELRVFTLDGRCLFEADQACLVPAGCNIDCERDGPEADEPVVAELRAVDAHSGELLARDCAWTEPFKFYRLGAAHIEARSDARGLSLRTDLPVKGLWLQAPGAALADNFLDLVPGEPLVVGLSGPLPTQFAARAVDLDDFGLRVLGNAQQPPAPQAREAR